MICGVGKALDGIGCGACEYGRGSHILLTDSVLEGLYHLLLAEEFNPAVPKSLDSRFPGIREQSRLDTIAVLSIIWMDQLSSISISEERDYEYQCDTDQDPDCGILSESSSSFKFSPLDSVLVRMF